MAESGRAARTAKSNLTTPESYPTSPQFPSGDYSYTLEVVMGMQKTLGELTEGIRNLTQQSKAHDEELKRVSRDVHAAKVVVSVVGGLLISAATFLGLFIKAYLEHLWSTPGK